ncbi:hypothetical protein QQW93_00400, partial [Pasteurella multocida]|uniref:hypothetical protein n=1 Tax=Pasteurella multocida TaxID=747 RepID=UPI002D1EDD1D
KQRFFYPQGVTADTRKNGDEASRDIDFGELIEHLIANGHRFSDIKHYTARQIALFYEKSLQRERRARAGRTMDTCYGVNGGKEIQDYINQLTA